MQRLLRSDAAALVFLLVATAAACAPLLRPGVVFSSWDAIFSALFVERLQWSLLSGADWHVGPVAWPLSDSIAQADWMGAQALLGLPLRWLPAHRMYAALSVLGLFLTALATQRVARALLGPGPHTWIAGVGGGLSCALVAHGPHINLVHHELVVLGGLLLAAGLEGDHPRRAALGGALLALSAHFGLYIGLHAAVVFAVLLLVLFRWRTARWALAGAALGTLTVLPILRVYARAADRYGLWYAQAARMMGSWDMVGSLRPSPFIPLHTGHTEPLGVNEIISQVNPGYALMALGASGAVLVLVRRTHRRRWAAVGAVLLVSAALALGPEIQLGTLQTGRMGPHWLLSALPGGRGFRVPSRWLQVTFIANALLAAAALEALGRRWPVLAVLAGGLVLAELPRVQPGPWTVADLAPEPVYDHLPASLAPLAEVSSVNTVRCSRFRSLAAAASHHRPLVGGAFARRSAELDRVNHLRGGWPSPDAAVFFSDVGVETVIEHPPLRTRGHVPAGWRCAEVERHRICQRASAP